MNRKLFGALLVAGGLALATSVTGFAQSYTPQSAKDAISACALSFKLTSPSTLGTAAAAATALNAEATIGLAEITAEANSSIAELAAEKADEDGPRDTMAVNARLSATVTEACQAVTNLQAEYAAALAELKAEATQPEPQPVAQKQPVQEKQDVEKPDVEKPDVEQPEVKKPEKPEVHSTRPEGND